MEWEQMMKLMDENKNENYNFNIKEDIVFTNEDIENLRIAERKKITKHSFKELMEFNHKEYLNDLYFNDNNNNISNFKLKKYN